MTVPGCPRRTEISSNLRNIRVRIRFMKSGISIEHKIRITVGGRKVIPELNSKFPRIEKTFLELITIQKHQ
ncbi:hypothetical protein LEP1GSC193_4165 [Leptospira alstonii serovar Pingchang str. 80-412]|uniref:Uncharacterized protein n=2 Tax=Leptospira alstonii TaxID=28452 RepID=M6D3W1_9LEPT|nr:hypothetical protein LEP1GSC194_1819 [Leptospira alstonii serovar Sichuan str. 79601]EQA78346.1 hypothetical protein LEP1GSC193_4165 [Leptospira alstonii serovar Pingchang str. 80-412]